MATDTDLFEKARHLCRRYRIGYWDAAVLAACERLGARVLYSEDLSHGQDYGGVRVVNPFRGADGEGSIGFADNVEARSEARLRET